MTLIVEWHGRITTIVDLDEYTVEEEFYPLCGMTVNTNVVSDDRSATVLPHSYKQRVLFET